MTNKIYFKSVKLCSDLRNCITIPFPHITGHVWLHEHGRQKISNKQTIKQTSQKINYISAFESENKVRVVNSGYELPSK